MPNGFHGSREEWQRLVAPLDQIDAELSAYAARHGMAFQRNTRNWPDRSLTWTSDGVRRLIQVWLRDDQQLTWTFGIAASQDRERKRYWKAESLVESAPIDSIKERLADLLNEATARLSSWTAEDLPFAGDLKPL